MAVTFVMVTTLIASITGIAMSGFSRVFIDRLLSGNDPDWLFPFIIGLLGLAIVQLAAEWIKSIYSLKINGKMAIVGNMSYMWKMASYGNTSFLWKVLRFGFPWNSSPSAWRAIFSSARNQMQALREV